MTKDEQYLVQSIASCDQKIEETLNALINVICSVSDDDVERLLQELKKSSMDTYAKAAQEGRISGKDLRQYIADGAAILGLITVNRHMLQTELESRS